MKVTVFGAPWCAFCSTEKQWLDSKSVSYDYVDVEEDRANLDRVVQLSGATGIPVTLIEDQDNNSYVVRGFNRPELSRHLGL